MKRDALEALPDWLTVRSFTEWIKTWPRAARYRLVVKLEPVSADAAGKVNDPPQFCLIHATRGGHDGD